MILVKDYKKTLFKKGSSEWFWDHSNEVLQWGRESKLNFKRSWVNGNLQPRSMVGVGGWKITKETLAVKEDSG